MIRIPFVPSIPNYTFSTVLDGVAYTFDAHWNGRAGAWYFDVYDSDGELIRAGTKITLGSILGGRERDERWPPGIIMASDLSDSGVEATLDDLGTRVSVYYYEADEL